MKNKGISIGNINIKGNDVFFTLRRESKSYSQYFYFFTQCKASKSTKHFYITNAKESQYPRGWIDYKIFYKYNDTDWKRIDSSKYNNGIYSFNLNIPNDCVLHLSWYQPYTINDLYTFLMRHNIEMLYLKKFPYLKFGNTEGKTIVLLARQHPGEIMSSFFIEGVIEKIMTSDFLDKNEIIIFPFVNLKGVENGCHRYIDNIDYNRSWDLDIPEINYIKEILYNKKVEFVVDIHGDEVSKINFSRKNINKMQRRILNKLEKNLNNFLALDYIPYWKRLIKSFLRRSPAKVAGLTAEEYFNRKKIPAITLELSARFDPEDHKRNGKQFVNMLVSENI